MHLFRRLCILLAALIFCFSGLAQADVEMQDLRTLNLDAKPIDMATSADGKYTFVLAEGGKVFIFDSTGKLNDTLKVSESVVSIGTNATGDYLLLADSSAKTLEVVRLTFIVDIETAGLPFKGPADAPVVIALFSDYQWPYCAKVKPLLEQVLEQYPNDVKMVIKNFPLTRIHKNSMGAAIASLAANQQGKYWEYSEELFKNFNKLSEEKYEEIAQSLGLNMEQFKQDLKDPTLAAMVQRDLQDGVQAGVRGTPSIFINGRLLQQRNLDGFKEIIDADLAKKGK